MFINSSLAVLRIRLLSSPSLPYFTSLMLVVAVSAVWPVADLAAALRTAKAAVRLQPVHPAVRAIRSNLS